MSISNRIMGGEVLDVTHWVGAVKRDAEGSYMQLQDWF